jgi:hypothetical protein
MSIFDSLAADVHAALADDARAGTLRRETSGGLDQYGDPVPPVVTTYPMRGWVENYDATWISAGIPVTDSKVVILARSISIEPKQSDKLSIQSKWWSVRAVERDPAGATYSLQCSEIQAPT